MIGYIRILKGQIINESKINRHILVNDENEYQVEQVSPQLVLKKLRGMRSSSWVSFMILIASVVILNHQNFWVAKMMTAMVIVIVSLNIYANAHNIINHERWIKGGDMLNSKAFLSLFMRKPIRTSLNAFRQNGVSHEMD